MEEKLTDEILAQLEGFKKEFYEDVAKKAGVNATALKLFLEDNKIKAFYDKQWTLLQQEKEKPKTHNDVGPGKCLYCQKNDRNYDFKLKRYLPICGYDCYIKAHNEGMF